MNNNSNLAPTTAQTIGHAYDGLWQDGIEPAADMEGIIEEKTGAEEILPGQIDAVQLYLRGIRAYPLLTAEEEVYFGRLARQGNPDGRRRMIVSNLRLVVKIARRYMNCKVPLLDLIEEGNLGLMHAVEKFDPELGFRFSTYATWWIRNAIDRAIMNQGRTIRLPIYRAKELNAYLSAIHKLSKGGNYDPSAEEIAAMTNKPVEWVRATAELAGQTTISIMTEHDASDLSLLDLIPDDGVDDPLERLQAHEEDISLETQLAKLTASEQRVMKRRFGLDGHEASTLEEVARELGVSRERVRQIQHKGIEKLRRLLA